MSTMRTTLATAVSLICSVTAFAGNLNAPSAPTDPGSAMYQLEDIYNRLDAGTPGSKRSGSFREPTAGPATTEHTLDEVMNKAPVANDINGVLPSGVLAGATYWSLRTGTGWGIKPGTMPNNGTSDYTPTITDQPVAEGYHSGAGIVTGDPDLTEGNIAEGVNLFGVVGAAKVATGDAVAENVLIGKSFSNSSAVGVDGTMPNIGDQDFTPTTTPQTIRAGYHDGNGTVTGDANLVEGNIVSGTTIFGVTGTANPYPALVPRTGQITCYNAAGTVIEDCASTRQDGDLLQGEAWPNPRFHKNANGVNDNGNGGGISGDGICNGTEACDGSVTDNLTGLVWLQDASCANFFSGDTTGQNSRPWEDALTAANSLAAGYCGLTDGSSAGDWHLPNRKELNSLLDSEFYSPALSDATGTAKWTTDGDAFSGVVSNGYWSSTTIAVITTGAWLVSLGNGGVSGDNKTDNHYVWPVKAGQ